MALPSPIMIYILQAFPNASNILHDIIRQHAQQITGVGGFGLVAPFMIVFMNEIQRQRVKISGNTVEKKPNVWVKELPHGKILILRVESKYDGNATLEIQKVF